MTAKRAPPMTLRRSPRVKVKGARPESTGVRQEPTPAGGAETGGNMTEDRSDSHFSFTRSYVERITLFSCQKTS